MTIDQAMQLAAQHQQARRFAEAENIYRQILAQMPDHPPALHALGIMAGQVGRADVAVQLIGRAAQIRPDDDCALHSDLSKFLCDLGQLDPAITEAQQAIRLKSDHAPAHYNLGIALNAAGRVEEAVTAFRTTVELMPEFAEGFNNLGAALNRLGKTDEAIAALSRAVQLKPDYARANKNLAETIGILGVTLAQKGELDDAIAAYRRALEIQPDAFEIHNNLAVALSDKGRNEDAIVEYQRAIQIKPDYADAHCNLAHALLLNGDFHRGWAEQQWRWNLSPPFPSVISSKPRWSGEPLDGKRILLHADQAFGDTIHLIRYATIVAGQGARVLLACQAPLTRLLAICPGVEQVADIANPLPEFDLHCPLFDLPRIVKTDLNSIPAPSAYLFAEPNLIEKFKSRLAPARAGQRIGLVWAGTPRAIFAPNRNRSITLSQLAPLAQVKGVEFVSLQKGEAAAHIPPAGLELTDLTADLADFADTAALVANLDLVISVDTSVAHLAAAMGKPVWLLLPFAADWRWMLDRDDSPWYPSMRIFRQQTIGDWTGVVDTIARQLPARLA